MPIKFCIGGLSFAVAGWVCTVQSVYFHFFYIKFRKEKSFFVGTQKTYVTFYAHQFEFDMIKTLMSVSTTEGPRNAGLRAKL